MHTIVHSPRSSLGKKSSRLRNVASWPVFWESWPHAQAPMFVIGLTVFVKAIFVLEMKVPVIAHITGPGRLFLWLLLTFDSNPQSACLSAIQLSNISYIF